MDIKVVSNTFPSEVLKVVLELLKHLEDPVEIRNNLTKYFKDVWIVIKGLSFAYCVSKSNKSAGLFQNRKSKSYFLIYNPPFIEISPQIPKAAPTSTEWIVFAVKKSEKTEEMNEKILKVLKEVSYDDTADASEVIKYRLNEIEDKFWHVMVGKDFTCVLPVDKVEVMIYAKAQKKKEMMDVVVFRKRGEARRIELFGLIKGSGAIILTFLFFLGIFGYLKCENEGSGWLCRNYSAFLYIGMAFIFAKSYGILSSKFR